MGLQGSPASFARLIDYVFRGIEGVITYIDDVLTHSKGHLTQLKVLEETLLRLRKYNLKLNPSKSVFGAASVHYLGYNISGEGIRPGEEKMKAIEDFPVPDTPKKIREFVGLANYFRFLLPGFAEHSARRTDLFQKGQPVQVRTASGRGTDCVQSTTDGPLFEPTGGAPIGRQGLHSHHGRGNRRLGAPGRDGSSPVPDAQQTRESYRLRQQGPEGQ